jgi:hypothetical protein
MDNKINCYFTIHGTTLIITNEWCHQKLTYETKPQAQRRPNKTTGTALYVSTLCHRAQKQQIVQLFCSLEGAIIALKRELGQKLT